MKPVEQRAAEVVTFLMRVPGMRLEDKLRDELIEMFANVLERAQQEAIAEVLEPNAN